EVLKGLKAEGRRILRANCSPLGQDIPLNPIIDLLRDPHVSAAALALDEPWRSVLKDLSPGLSGLGNPAPYIEPAGVARRLYDAIRRLLEGAGTDDGVLWI